MAWSQWTHTPSRMLDARWSLFPFVHPNGTAVECGFLVQIELSSDAALVSFVIPTVAQVVLLALVFWYRFKEARHADGTRYFDAFKVAMHNINLAMLPWVLGLDIYGLVYQDSLDWLRVGCILYMAGLYACQIILTAVAVPRYIWDKPVIGLGISCLAVLAIPTWYTFAAKFRRAFDAAPHCYDQDQPTEFAEVLGIGSAIFVVQAFLLALATFLNWDKPGAGPLSPSTELQRLAWWPLWRVALFLVVPLGLLVLITVFLLNDINAVRPWMNPAESHMGLSEFLIVLVAAGAVATTLCNAADLDNKVQRFLLAVYDRVSRRDRNP